MASRHDTSDCPLASTHTCLQVYAYPQTYVHPYTQEHAQITRMNFTLYTVILYELNIWYVHKTKKFYHHDQS